MHKNESEKKLDAFSTEIDGVALDFSQFPVKLVGHSHIYTMGGFEKPDDGFDAAITFREDPVENTIDLSICHGEWPRTDQYWSDIQNLGQSQEQFLFALSYRGNDHLARFLIQPQNPIDYFSSEFPELPVDESSQIVPEALIEALFFPDYEPLRAIVRGFVETGRRVIIIGTPPPKLDDGFLQTQIVNESYFSQICESLNINPEEVIFSSGDLRMKLWGMLQSFCRKICSEEGAEFIPVPKEAVEENLSLKSIYWAEDCTHANRRYGKLVLEDLARYLNETGIHD